MAQGLPYDSDEGRAQAAAITALMTGHSYATSAKLARRVGPFAGFHKDRDNVLNVLRMHRAAVDDIDAKLVSEELLSAAATAWDEAVELGELYGVRNSQASVLAPTGTIGLMMDCDTTGIEPDLGLVKYKKLVGGGSMIIVNQTVPRALTALGYTKAQADEIVAFIDVEKTIKGAQHLKEEHKAVFSCSMGDNPIHYLGHVKMMGAVQPFISGAISKTVNMPEEVSVEDIEQLHIDAWKLGIKAVAIYRDNCKVGQPLNMAKKGADANNEVAASAEPATATASASVESVNNALIVKGAVRRRLPRVRGGKTYSFRVADAHGYVTVGEYEDGTPGELFLRVAKQGSTLAGIMDAFAISVSHGLQYGVPLKTYVSALTNMSFAPSGITDDKDVRTASSLVDYIFKRLARDYLSFDDRLELGLASIEDMPAEQTSFLDMPAAAPAPVTAVTDIPVEPIDKLVAASASPKVAVYPIAKPALSAVPSAVPTVGDALKPKSMPNADSHAPICYNCGNQTQKAGSCYVCTSCGSTTGCS